MPPPRVPTHEECGIGKRAGVVTLVGVGGAQLRPRAENFLRGGGGGSEILSSVTEFQLLFAGNPGFLLKIPPCFVQRSALQASFAPAEAAMSRSAPDLSIGYLLSHFAPGSACEC